MRMLWREGASSFEGEHFRFHDADIGPRPANLHGPPILVAADKVRTAARVPKIGGDHWIASARHSGSFLREALPEYKRSLQEMGREFTGLPMTRDICVAKDERAARAVVQRSYERMLHMQSGWGQPGERYDVPFEQLQADRIILGSPEQAAEGLVKLNREFGAQFTFFRVYTPGMDPQTALDMVTQIGEEVLPLVRREVGRTSLFADHP
jgi:alkanesulfonate monooxygenase SsuD/methylene tetrahydromethanopterin reductase-like flavin-dependent oxidoreductase (luciferase family)